MLQPNPRAAIAAAHPRLLKTPLSAVKRAAVHRPWLLDPAAEGAQAAVPMHLYIGDGADASSDGVDAVGDAFNYAAGDGVDAVGGRVEDDLAPKPTQALASDVDDADPRLFAWWGQENARFIHEAAAPSPEGSRPLPSVGLALGGLAGAGAWSALRSTSSVHAQPPSVSSVVRPSTTEEGAPAATEPPTAAAPRPLLRLLGASTPIDGLPAMTEAQVLVEGLEADAQWFYRLSADGDWQLGTGDRLPPTLFDREGEHLVEVMQEDLAGNQSDVAQLRFLIDRTPPVAPVLALQHDTGWSGDDGWTQDATVAISSLERDAHWSFSLDGGATWNSGQGDQIADDHFSGDGRYEVIVRTRDPAGHETVSAPLTFTRDTAAPTTAPTVALSIDSGIPNDRLTARALLQFGQLEPGARWSFTLDGLEWFTADSVQTASSSEAMFVRDGRWSVRARQVDAAGNLGPLSAPFEFELDRTPPPRPTPRLLRDTGRFADDRVTSDATVVIDGLLPGDTAFYKTDRSPAIAQAPRGRIEGILFQDDGRYTVSVQVRDAAGNLSEWGALTFDLDRRAPLIPALVLQDAAVPPGAVL